MKIDLNLEMQSTRSLILPEDFLSVVRLQCDMLPEYLPQKFGWSEPLKLPFDPQHLDNLIPTARGPGSLHEAAVAAGVKEQIPQERYSGGVAENTWWKRTGKNRASGGWLPGWRQKHPSQMESTHASSYLWVYETRYQERLIAYLKAGCIYSECDFGFLDGDTERYRPYAKQSNMWSGGLRVNTHLLRHWLPDMFWATVLGPAYVRMFGKDHILGSPAYVVEELGPETVYLQLTPKLEDVEEHFDEVMAARQRLKLHLGMNAFFQREIAEREYACKPKQLAMGATYRPTLPYDRNDHPENAGRVFRTPEFRLNPN